MRIAVLLPCYNEAASIEKTIESFQQALPHAKIYVFDNNSADDTAAIARKAGAIVQVERYQGKGAVVRRMFADVDADFYVMSDGDLTYDASRAPEMIGLASESNLDMVVGLRAKIEDSAYPSGHEFGNRMLNLILQMFFGRAFEDILSGYRVFSRRFVKSFPALSRGFEIETELSVHALRMRMPVAEIETDYAPRIEGSESKLSTFKDGFRILSTMINLMRQDRPLLFFSILSLIFLSASASAAFPIVVTYLETGLVPRFPTLILSAALLIVSFLLAFTGLILDSVVRGRQEALRMAYLRVSLEGQRRILVSEQVEKAANPREVHLSR